MIRTKRVNFVLSEAEYDLIREKMKSIGMNNFSGYVRKMASDGYIIRLETKALDRIVTELKHIGNNVNQIAKRSNSGAEIQSEELTYLSSALEKVRKELHDLIVRISEIIK